MREVKFRAWNGEEMKDVFSVQSNGDGILYRGEIMQSWKLMQFTGLYDKNGKEIYEGDIIAWSTDNIVYWSQKECAFFAKPIGYGDLTESWLDSTCEVIGNIYENPELVS